MTHLLFAVGCMVMAAIAGAGVGIVLGMLCRCMSEDFDGEQIFTIAFVLGMIGMFAGLVVGAHFSQFVYLLTPEQAEIVRAGLI